MYDVVIIGAGVIGCSVARELSRYRLKIAVLERGSEVCEGTSKANSGIVHAGYDATYGTRKAQLNIEGNLKMEQLCRDLEVPFKRNGSLVLCMQEEDLPILSQLMDNGLKNGVPGLQLLQKEEVLRMEPQVNKNVVGALYAPTGGIVCPFTLTIALAENAYENGVEFYLNTTVTEIKKAKDDEGYIIHTNQGGYQSRVVINAAGVYADVFHNMVSEQKIKITARKGEYCLIDKDVGNFVTRTLFPLPSRYGKGVLVTPTIHGNLMVGPTAMDCEEKEEINTTEEGLREASYWGSPRMHRDLLILQVWNRLDLPVLRPSAD
ncbi:MAG: putative dehydrogenase [Herbinix sp.]|nr:putative dehydrogenase [Herbinix sp.]